VVRVGDKLIVLDPVGGNIIQTIPMSGSAVKQNEMQQGPVCVYLKTATGGVVAAMQIFYKEEDRGQNGKSYNTRETAVTGFNDEGLEIWKKTFDKNAYIQSMDALPSPRGGDWLMIVMWNQLLLLDPLSGSQLFEQRIGYGSRLEITDRNGDGIAEFTLIGASAACYELKLPE
jgi:hypothetical protein